MFCYTSGARNFEVAPRFVENLCNPGNDYDCVTFRIRELTKMTNGERTNEKTNKQTKYIKELLPRSSRFSSVQLSIVFIM